MITGVSDIWTQALKKRREWITQGRLSGEAYRAFHGPFDGIRPGKSLAPDLEWLREIAIERFGPWLWVTAWTPLGDEQRAVLARVLEQTEGVQGAVGVYRPERGTPEPAQVLFGNPPERLTVTEDGAQYEIRLRGERHPGLFLDHAPLRRWLMREPLGARVLNLFSYTGSLSISAAVGAVARASSANGSGAATGRRAPQQIVSVDLSRPTSEWARENARLNGLKVVSLSEADSLRAATPEPLMTFVAGDVFQFLAQAKKRGERYDTVLCDPPSFSRSKAGIFSTENDSARLHADICSILNPGGLVATSINSSKILRVKFEDKVREGARSVGCKLDVIAPIAQPESFGGDALTRPEDLYLKGVIARVNRF